MLPSLRSSRPLNGSTYRSSCLRYWKPTSGKTARRGAADTITSERLSRLFAWMPQLLQAVKMWDSECPSPLGHRYAENPDSSWLPYAGRNRWL